MESFYSYYICSVYNLWLRCTHLTVRVYSGIDQSLQDQLSQFIFQGSHCGIKSSGHLAHVCRHIGAEVLEEENIQLPSVLPSL